MQIRIKKPSRQCSKLTKFFITFCRYHYPCYAVFEYKTITIVHKKFKQYLWMLAAEKTEKCRQFKSRAKEKAAQYHTAPLKNVFQPSIYFLLNLIARFINPICCISVVIVYTHDH